MGEIVDNSPEMDLGSQEFKDMLSSVAPEPKVEEGVKEKDTPSPVVSEKGEVEKQDDSPDALKAQIRGLKAELTRRSGNADKVGELESQLQDLQEQLKVVQAQPKPQPDSLAEAISKLDDKGVIAKLTDWQDELAAARAKYERAEENGDTAKLELAQQRITHAKRVLSALNEETQARQERKAQQAEEARSEASTINEELVDMYEAVNEVFPDFQDPESELWKAGNDEFNKHPKLMARMGPAGELVAAALAIVRNPKLAPGKGNAAARRDVLSKIDKGLSKALAGGAASPSTGRTVDWGAAVSTGDNLAQFNATVDKIKGGG